MKWYSSNDWELGKSARHSLKMKDLSDGTVSARSDIYEKQTRLSVQSLVTKQSSSAQSSVNRLFQNQKCGSLRALVKCTPSPFLTRSSLSIIAIITLHKSPPFP